MTLTELRYIVAVARERHSGRGVAMLRLTDEGRCGAPLALSDHHAP